MPCLNFTLAKAIQNKSFKNKPGALFTECNRFIDPANRSRLINESATAIPRVNTAAYCEPSFNDQPESHEQILKFQIQQDEIE